MVASNSVRALCGLILAAVASLHCASAQKTPSLSMKVTADDDSALAVVLRLNCDGRPKVLMQMFASHWGGKNDRQCGITEFWNSDLDVCVSCSSCKQYPKTPSCNTCNSVEETRDVWKLAAITSFSVLAVVLVGAALIIGVMVHRRKSHKRPLREPIEETAGPLYQA